MTDNTNQSLKRLEATTGSLNFLTAITNLLKPGDSAATSAMNLVRWLSREGLDESSFTACASLARGLVYPTTSEHQSARRSWMPTENWLVVVWFLYH
ncbi:hypothetical protein N431DRAFT_433461 [Stipitochalara longipes BDJ]|nr:hypothetical protein N431DRAFT_433461 [Stipitochalara longipes BDJ]